MNSSNDQTLIDCWCDRIYGATIKELLAMLQELAHLPAVEKGANPFTASTPREVLTRMLFKRLIKIVGNVEVGNVYDRFVYYNRKLIPEEYRNYCIRALDLERGKALKSAAPHPQGNDLF